MDTLETQIENPLMHTTVSQSEFTDCVDRCVTTLLSSAETPKKADQARLCAWLAGESHALDDGTPIDFELFDSTILTVEERVLVTDMQTRTRLLGAARQLAETVYANVLAQPALANSALR